MLLIIPTVVRTYAVLPYRTEEMGHFPDKHSFLFSVISRLLDRTSVTYYGTLDVRMSFDIRLYITSI